MRTTTYLILGLLVGIAVARSDYTQSCFWLLGGIAVKLEEIGNHIKSDA